MKIAGALLALAVLAVPAAAAEKDVEKIPSCQYCGMDRAKFASTRNVGWVGACSAAHGSDSHSRSVTPCMRRRMARSSTISTS